MARVGEKSLVISDGGVGSLVACLLGDDPSGLVAWLPPLSSPGVDVGGALIGATHRQAVEEQSALLGLERVELARPIAWGEAGADADGRGGVPLPVASLMPRASQLLLAAEDALRLGCATVIWPVVCGEDLEAMFAAEELAALTGRLAGLTIGPGGGGIPRRARGWDLAPRIEIPLADLTVEQVCDLALDLDAPVDRCWWQRRTAESERWAIEARLTWEPSLRRMAEHRGLRLGAEPGPGRARAWGDVATPGRS